ncbi:MAG: DUF3014 domain-containing protein [Halioglobus sp.]|nr:DUF3014 domain-containing protein [Halioglobus sp.]
MKATPDEQLSPHARKKRFPLVELLLALAVVAALILFWRDWQEKAPHRPTMPDVAGSPAPKSPKVPPTPDIPRRDPSASISESAATAGRQEPALRHTLPEQAETVPTPLTAEQGDALLRRALTQAGPNIRVQALASSEQPLDTTAILIDGLGRGLILRKVLPLSPPKPGFKAEPRGDILYMDESNYSRYNTLAETVSALNTEQLVNSFHALRPLFEAAYEKLGLNSEDFDNAVIRALDQALATPEIEDAVALRPKSVVYVYANPALEALPDLQKQLLRMGPDNLRLIKVQAKALRNALLAQ